MKILTISDLHGRTVWKETNFDTYDRVIFLGDYTDSYVVDDETIYNNLYEIIQLKRKARNKFVLLIGNHDAQYLHFPNYRCSGFRAWAQPSLSNLFAKYESFFQIAHQEKTYLFTHAGVTNRWMARLLEKTGREMPGVTPDYNLAGLLNDIHQQTIRIQNLLFEVGPKRGGSDLFSGPVWADRSETKADYLPEFHQVVGHTPIDEFTTFGGQAGSITYTDVLQTKTAFYEVVIPD
ncbi:metallophosphoesterase [Spirosoma sp. KNUC1025]|uniref:metallophosphoesterase n=1 Tax=Spirosoma sp. KNUC1025 TaxID=2894082 RepID=UPI0038640F71|nr:metallophosphoesterase [Spirosoma sp. KNUC1025]